MHRHGIPPKSVRVSNLTHEVAISLLKVVQDIDRDTWEDVVTRLESANSIKHLKDHALDSVAREKMRRRFKLCDEKLVGTEHELGLYMAEITTIIRNDHYFTGLSNS